MEESDKWDPRPPPGMDRGFDPGPNQPRTLHTYPYNMPPFDYLDPYYVDDEGAKGLGLASMIIGIVSIGLVFIGGAIFAFICLLPLVASIVGLVLGSISVSKFKKTGATEGKGMAIAGVILNSVCLVISIIGIALMIIFFAMFFGPFYF